MRPPQHDWRRTHAVVVAVEEYAGGADWELSGPANDAARMVQWLLDRGVPQRQVHLLASPLARNEGLLARYTDVRRSTADRVHVHRVFQDELRNLDVDWLWVYWAGHGVQAGGNRWSLLYPESRTGHPQGVDADNLTSLLRTECLPARGVERAVVIIDACRTTLPPREHARALTPDTIATEAETNTDRPVFLLRAVAPGEAAKNRADAGLFTSTLMDALEAGSRDDPQAAPDLDRAWTRVKAEFNRLREVEGTGQTPTALRRNWGNNEDDAPQAAPGPPPPEGQRHVRSRMALLVGAALIDDRAATARVAAGLGVELRTGLPCAPDRLDAKALVDWALIRPRGIATLLHLLAPRLAGASKEDKEALRHTSLELDRGHWLLCSEYDALVGLFTSQPAEVTRGFARAARQEQVNAVIEATEPRDVVDHLEDLSLPVPGESRLPRLLGAVERAAAAAGDGPYATELRDWSMKCASRLGGVLPDILVNRRGELMERAAADAAGGGHEAAEGQVQIRLSPSGPGGRRTYQVWSHGPAGVESVETQDVPVAAADVRLAVDAILTRYGRVHSTLVEFFLEAADLELDVHRWRIGADDPVKRSLGTDFPVVVRCTEHRRPTQQHLWLRRWERVATARSDDLHWLPDDLDSVTAAHGCVSAREDAPGVVVPGAAHHREAVFTACLFGGVPVMLWRGGSEIEGGEEELKSVLTGCSLHELPGKLRRIRAECDVDEQLPGSRLALLWDDPGRPLPQRLDLSAP
ncbi:caspase family protein [Streptomyces sp. DT20]|uniref:VMAP-C domain-containing protein n=1 Tax=Streptomyces sp. DT20 TaxID=3416519 RepID=UPI003CECD62E